MSTIALTRQQQRELDTIIELINEFIASLKNSRAAVSDFVDNCKFCMELRKQRKVFVRHTKMTMLAFPKMSEKNQVSLELHYFKGIKVLKKLLPDAEAEIKKDYIFPINSFILRELNKTVNAIVSTQEEMSKLIYKDHSQEILSNPDLYNELVENWADLENN